VKSISTGILENSGHLLENLVYITLRRKNEKVFYYRTGTGLEVDFVTVEAGRKRRLIQVAENLMSPKTRERELKALVAAMREQKIKDGTIVTRLRISAKPVTCFGASRSPVSAQAGQRC
jgi:uncharacterized protein